VNKKENKEGLGGEMGNHYTYCEFETMIEIEERRVVFIGRKESVLNKYDGEEWNYNEMKKSIGMIFGQGGTGDLLLIPYIFKARISFRPHGRCREYVYLNHFHYSKLLLLYIQSTEYCVR